MDEFSVESKEYEVTDGVSLPDNWDELSTEERIDYLFGERTL